MCGFSKDVKEDVPTIAISRDSFTYVEPSFSIQNLTKDQIEYVIGALGTTASNDNAVGQKTYEKLFDEAHEWNLEINPVTLGLLKVADLTPAERVIYEVIAPEVTYKLRTDAATV